MRGPLWNGPWVAQHEKCVFGYEKFIKAAMRKITTESPLKKQVKRWSCEYEQAGYLSRSDMNRFVTKADLI